MTTCLLFAQKIVENLIYLDSVEREKFIFFSPDDAKTLHDLCVKYFFVLLQKLCFFNKVKARTDFNYGKIERKPLYFPARFTTRVSNVLKQELQSHFPSMWEIQHNNYNREVLAWSENFIHEIYYDRTVEQFNLHSLFLYQLKRNFVLYKTTQSFFFKIYFSF